MKEFIVENLLYLNILGHKQICSHNGDTLYSFNMFSRIQLIDLIQTKLKESYCILIPPYIC